MTSESIAADLNHRSVDFIVIGPDLWFKGSDGQPRTLHTDSEAAAEFFRRYAALLRSRITP